MKPLLSFLAFLTIVTTFPPVTQAGEPTAAIKAAQELRIPKVELREASLQESIDFLSKKSRDEDPNKKGINIAIGGKIDPNSKITLSLSNASVFDIVQVIAGQVGMKIEPLETVLMLAPKAN